MKKRNLVMVAIVALGYAFPSIADDSMGKMDMSNMKMDMAKPAAQVAAQPASKTAHGMGVIKSMDNKQGMVTLAHEAIKDLNWPPMVMDFKVADAKLMKGLKVGQKVNFELQADGMGGVVTAMSPAK